MHFVNTDRTNKVVIYFESSSICVSPDFGGLTGISVAVRPAASRRSDRRRKGGQTGGGDSKWQLIRRLDRSFNLGQTGGFQTVRPTRLPRSDRDPSISRVTFISAKSFYFLGISTIHPPSGWLSSCDSILQNAMSKTLERRIRDISNTSIIHIQIDYEIEIWWYMSLPTLYALHFFSLQFFLTRIAFEGKFNYLQVTWPLSKCHS